MFVAYRTADRTFPTSFSTNLLLRNGKFLLQLPTHSVELLRVLVRIVTSTGISRIIVTVRIVIRQCYWL